MHAVDGDELLGDRVWNAEVVGLRAGNATNYLTPADSSHQVVDPLRGESPPVASHRNLHDGTPQDAGGPFDCVDFGDKSGIDQTGFVEEIVIRPRRVLLAQAVADRVVLQGEEGVEQAETHPPIAVHPSDIDSRSGVERKQAVAVNCQLAVFTRANLTMRLLVAAIELRGI